MTSALTLPADLDRALVDLYRRWDKLEHAAHGGSVIDFDLAAPRAVVPHTSREAVLADIEALTAEAAGLAAGAGRDLVLARLNASATYLKALIGESIPIREYIRETMGVEPMVFPEGLLEHQQDKVNGLMRNRRLAFDEDARHRFESAFYLRDSEALQGQLDFFRDKWMAALRQHVDVPVDSYEITMEFAKEDAYWKNWISGNLASHTILWRINVHPRHLWYQGSAEMLALHEYCGHAVQMVNWHRRIEWNELPQFAGILTVHMPDQFLLEGLAESLAHTLPNAVRLEAKSLALRELHRYSLMVLNNVHLLANEEGSDAAFEYGAKRLPFTRPDTLRREIRDRTSHPLFRCYQYVYGIAQHAFVQSMSRLRDEHKWQLLKRIYDGPLTPAQFDAAVAQVDASSRQRATGR